MAECSLCNGPMEPEGGAVLFTDYRGIPFEVCGKCVGSIDRLHNSSGEEDAKRALDYISGCAENIENRGVYNELMRFVESELPSAEPKMEPEEEEEQEAYEVADESAGNEERDVEHEPAEGGKKNGSLFYVVLGAVLVVILIIIFVLKGIRF